ncbi:MAG: fasciclin domain-containing protein, partial [Nocardioides sp.]
LTRTGGLAAAALTLSLGLAACGGEEEPTSGSDNTTQSEEPTQEDTEMEEDASAQTYGAGCAQVPTSGAGSFDGMVTEPVASAASANPLLKTLVAAVTEAQLVEPLNSAPALTVFAPADPAFEAIPPKDMEAVMADKKMLGGILTHHVVGEQIAPDQLSGEFETLNGDMLTINGSGEQATIGDEKAQVLCGNIKTANATVYVIDTVMMPS